jgi:hypothetical protein
MPPPHAIPYVLPRRKFNGREKPRIERILEGMDLPGPDATTLKKAGCGEEKERR